jgi:hypothetical protein
MSIHEDILARISEGRLTVLSELVPTGPEVRRMLLAPAVLDAVDGPWTTATLSRRLLQTRALLESFIRGDEMTIRMPPSTTAKTMIALLKPASENVWAFRARLPAGIRVFGRFAARDVFVATNWAMRESLLAADGKNDPAKWRIEFLTCKNVWNRLFPSYNPLDRTDPHDFISNARLFE